MRKFLPVLLVVLLMGVLLAGCSVVVDGGPPRYGDVKICVEENYPWIYGYVYIDDRQYDYIDAWDRCTEWIRLKLDEPHLLEVRDPGDEKTTYGPVWFTPTDGYTHSIPY
ncbi:MAG: hypothetical protein PWP04_1593 [Candidatus Atribacteria bacterium]|nr:hypothetical protein [Candidatus Atribacteria bacterium]